MNQVNKASGGTVDSGEVAVVSDDNAEVLLGGEGVESAADVNAATDVEGITGAEGTTGEAEVGTELSEQDRAILDFESRLWKKTAVKERAISAELGITAATFYQRLIALTGMPEAHEYAPSTLKRLTEQKYRRHSRMFE